MTIRNTRCNATRLGLARLGVGMMKQATLDALAQKAGAFDRWNLYRDAALLSRLRGAQANQYLDAVEMGRAQLRQDLFVLAELDFKRHGCLVDVGADATLSRDRADYVCISTHSETLHQAVVERLGRWSYRIEVSSGVDTHTTSYDGFVLATSPQVAPLLRPFTPLGSLEIVQASPVELLQSLNAAASWPAT